MPKSDEPDTRHQSDPRGRDAPPDRTRVSRGSAGALMHDAVRRMILDATLDDLTAFVTVSRLAETSGVSTGGIYSAFPPAGDADGRRRGAPQVAARDAFLALDGQVNEISEVIIDAIGRFVEESSSDVELVQSAADLIAQALEVEARGTGGAGWDYSHLWIAAAVAINDPEVHSAMAATSRAVEAGYAEVVTELLAVTERVTVDGVSVEDLSQMLLDAADAGALRIRIFPDSGPRAISRLMTAVFVAATRRVDDLDDDLAQRLARTSVVVDPGHRERVGAAVREIVSRTGWEDATFRSVAAATGLDRAVVVAVAPTRHHLAAFVWSDVVDSIVRRAAHRAALGLEVQVVELVHDVADAACSRRSVVASLLHARLRDGAGGDEPECDPHTDRLVAILSELLIGLAQGDPGLRKVAARTAVDALLVAAATSDSGATELASILIAGLIPASVDVRPLDPGREVRR